MKSTTKGSKKSTPGGEKESLLPRAASRAKLYRWLLVQRASERNGKLLQERKERLESLGVDLEAKNLKWRHRFEELKQYNAKHGTCEVQVCANQKEAKALRQWVYLQRIANNSGKLTGDQIQQLESINFTWKGTRGAQELSNKILTSTLFEICEITALCLATLVTNANLLGGEPPSSISFHPKARDEDVQSLGDHSVPRFESQVLSPAKTLSQKAAKKAQAAKESGCLINPERNSTIAKGLQSSLFIANTLTLLNLTSARH
ncbi:hypothetical protein THAOC_14446 [Thalassiosira oceanica]|uniref:Helicase-associated domain-containing protein n=1 Tax=Thalassiosira oceanica TaxID=159749 RepID=K0SUU0_THAOC|nr:hypothetical protein THAOC_14446 [Thalassiosira oceanica]|eukprot:EJK64786.1 hypothetical protein THAOC_14446 [Thalassiosira oceanica]